MSSITTGKCGQNYQVIRAKEIDIPDCFLEGLNYFSNPALEAENIKNLENLQHAGQQLPIYLINAHGLVISNIFLTAPPGMDKSQVQENREYTYDYQLELGFGISRAKNHYFELQNLFPDFVTLDKNTFVITALPIGVDGVCNDVRLQEFLNETAKDNFQMLRSTLFSENGVQLFSQEVAPATFTPPGYSAINKWYSFSDKFGKKETKDKWGIYKLDKNFQQTFGNIFHDTGRDIHDIDSQLQAIHPNTELKEEISESIKTNEGLYLSEIIDKLGPGIYIDVGCSGIRLSVYEKLKEKSGVIKRIKNMYDPEDVAADIHLHALQNAIKEDYDKVIYNTNLAWTTMFSKGTLPPPEGGPYTKHNISTGYTPEQQKRLNIDREGNPKLTFDQKDIRESSVLTSLIPPDEFTREEQFYLNQAYAEGDETLKKGERPEQGKLDIGYALRGVHMSDRNLMEEELKKPPGLQQHQLTKTELETLYSKYGQDVVMAKLDQGYTNTDYERDKAEGEFNKFEFMDMGYEHMGGRKKRRNKKTRKRRQKKGCKRHNKKTYRKRNKRKKYKKSKKHIKNKRK